MALDSEQIAKLLLLVKSTVDDQLDCDRCFVNMAEFAEKKLHKRSLDDAMASVATHLDSCACCSDEFATLLVALYELELAAEGEGVVG